MTERGASRLAYSLVGLYAVLTLAGLAVAVLNGRIPDGAVLFVGLAAYALVGGLVAVRRPRNPIGWLMLCSPIAFAVGVLCDELSIYGFVTAPGTVPMAEFATWISQWVWIVVLAPLVFVVLLFPSGRLPSPRWRPIAWVVAMVFFAIAAIFAFASPGNDLHPEIRNPFALPALLPLARLVEDSFGVFIFVLGLAVLSIIARYRAASLLERQQLKWIVMAGVFMVIAFAGGEALPSPIGEFGSIAALVALPIAIAIAIFRHRLYDIDVLINRALVYGATTLGIGAAFFGGIVALQSALSPFTSGSELAVAASTLVSFAIFQPIRRRVQHTVDRRFDRSRYDASRTLDAFADQLRDEVDLDTLRADLIGAVRQTMAPAHASLWLRGGER